MRLTKVDRRRMENNLIEQAFAGRVQELQEWEHDLARRAWEAAAGRHARALQNLPERLCRRETKVHLHLKHTKSWSLGAATPLPSPRGEMGLPENSGEIVAELEHFKQAQRQIETDRSDEAKRVRAALESFSTTEKLLEQWPEVRPFVPAHAMPGANLPAVPVAELNERLGLTPSDEQAN